MRGHITMCTWKDGPSRVMTLQHGPTWEESRSSRRTAASAATSCAVAGFVRYVCSSSRQSTIMHSRRETSLVSGPLHPVLTLDTSEANT
jgi:hypothetical protein